MKTDQNEIKKTEEQFLCPSAGYRSLPFWAWNGKMEEDELIRQLHFIKSIGMGGAFAHSRDGLETEYLGREWMRCIRAAAEEAEKSGLYLWLYDEDRWPSGSAGGRVPGKGDAFRLKGLTLEVKQTGPYVSADGSETGKADAEYRKILREECPSGCSSDFQNGLQALYAAETGGMEIASFQRLSLDGTSEIRACNALLVVRLQVSAPSERFNQETPPDNLNPECVREFLRETHEKYKAAVGDMFGETVPGIFTDEPSLHDSHAFFGNSRGWIPWTYGYAEDFEKQFGYDFFDRLPYLYFNGAGSVKIRYDYWYMNSLRFGESYFKTIQDWCHRNRLKSTGHCLQEDKMGLSARVNGSVMPHYEYQDIMGIDMLTESTDEYMTVKQCSSVASQFGCREVISEMYGCTGWDFTYEGQKWTGDWQYVLGVNRRCQHLMLYTLRGLRKRDYPPSFNYHNNWAAYNRAADDYFARLGVVLCEGRAVRKVLLLHPQSTVWCRLGVSPYGNPVRREERDIPALDRYGERYNQLIKKLVAAHFDCDLGDEMLIRKYGSSEDGEFRIGKCGYRAVVMPRMENLFGSTAMICLKYLEQGGTVLALAPLPSLIDGEADRSGILEKILHHKRFVLCSDEESLLQNLEPVRIVSIREKFSPNEAEKILCQLRHTDSGDFLFLINNDRNREYSTEISVVSDKHGLEEWDLRTGEIKNAAAGYRDGVLRFDTHFGKTGSRLFRLKEEAGGETEERKESPDRNKAGALPSSGGDACGEETVTLPEECSCSLTEPNVLTLDMCSYSMNGEAFSETMEVWQAQCEIRSRLHMKDTRHNGLSQRYRWAVKPEGEKGTPVSLRFSFTSDIACECALVIETPERFQIRLDRTAVENAPDGFFLDRSFERIPLGMTEPGYHVIELNAGYTNDMELENIYLTGSFGVDGRRHITKLPEKLHTGDWCLQGLYHYCGDVIYQYAYDCIGNGKRIYLQVTEVSAACIAVSVNGDKEQVIPWEMTEPYEITDRLHDGANRIFVKVAGSPRNMLGPLHLKGGRPLNTHDASFCPEPEEYTASYQLVPYGLMSPVKIISKDG
jgi:hypothetical protein